MLHLLRLKTPALAVAAPAVMVTAALAGGFWISAYSPAAPVAANIRDAVVVIAAEGCANPSDAKLNGTAEGLVRGQRQSVALQFTPTSKPGVYAVKKQWPAEGAWVLSITGDYRGHNSTVLVELEPNGKFRAEPARAGVKAADRVEAALRAMAARTS